MSVLKFVWAGDLDENKTQKLQNPQALFQEKCHPMTMIVRQDKKETRIGRKNSKMPPDYALESAVSNRMISRNHVTIERLSKGNYMMYDHSLNGTYVNYCRVIGGTILKNEDIVCFGHINGANVKPGESVTPFSTDLKYRVEIVERDRERPTAKSEQFSESSEEDVSKMHNLTLNEPRKLVKLPKSVSDQSGHSSDSSDISAINQANNYHKAKKTYLSSEPSSEDDRLKVHVPKKERSIYEKIKVNKSKKHSPSMSGGRYLDPRRKRKLGTEMVQPKINYTKKIHESKRPKFDEDRRTKERKTSMVHKSHNKMKYSDPKSSKRNNNINSSNYEYEECRAHPCRRPDGENPIDWIMCDKCNQWFHQFCVGLDEAVEDDESYYCPYCANN